MGYRHYLYAFELIASIYVESKYNDLKDRIKKLENKKENK